MHCENSMVMLYGLTTFANLKSASPKPWVKAAATHFVQMHAFGSVITNKYAKGYEFDSCTFNITKKRIDTVSNIAKTLGTFDNTLRHSE